MLLSEVRVNVVLICSALLCPFLHLFRPLFSLFLSFVVCDAEVDHLPELHAADVRHCQTPLKSSEDYIVERYVVVFG